MALTCSQAFTSGTSSAGNGRMRIFFEHKQTILLELAPPQHGSADTMALVPMIQGERHPTSSDIGYLSRLVKKARYADRLKHCIKNLSTTPQCSYHDDFFAVNISVDVNNYTTVRHSSQPTISIPTKHSFSQFLFLYRTYKPTSTA
jgi:hypothetical protein